MPFFVLIRGAVFLYLTFSMPPWIALVVGAGMMFVVFFVYCMVLLSRTKRGLEYSRGAAVGTAIMVCVYCVYTGMFVSGINVKHPEIKSTYRVLHPLLRVALGTFIIVDEGVVVTSSSRKRGTYSKMGLAPLENSYHYVQKDGYVHAVDLRTVGRSWFSNSLMHSYFWLMGFRTLRHVGTADHLHVSLAVAD